MANIADLFARLLVDDSGFEAAVVKSAGSAGAKGGQALSANLSTNVRSGLAGVGKGILAGLGLGAGLGAFQLTSRAVGELTDVLGDSVKMAIEEQAGIKQLTQSLKTNVPAWDGDIEAIERRIAAGEELGFADDDLRKSLALLVGSTHDVARAFEIQALAEDLARFKNVSLADATDELIKVQAGSFRSLKALGIELKAGATSAEAFGAIQAVVAGQSQAFADTTEGKMARASVSINNLKEDIGKGLIPVLGDLADAIHNVLGGDAAGLPDKAADFAKTATLAQLKAAREGIAAELAKAHDVPPSVIFAMRDSIAALDKAIREANNRMSEGARVGETYDAELAAAAKAAADLAASTSTATPAQIELAAATIKASEAHKDLAEAMAAAEAAGSGNAGAMRDLADAQDADAAAALKLKAAQDAVKDAQDAAARNAGTASDAWKAFAGDLRGVDSTAMQLITDLITLNGMHVEATIDLNLGGVEAGVDATGVFDRMARDAADAAKRYADEVRRALSDAFRDSKAAADALFDALHHHNLDAIEDARATASALLEEQKRGLLQPVDEAQAALDAKRKAAQRRGLQAGVASAAQGIGEAGDDPKDLASAIAQLRDARAALADFDAQAAIDAQRTTAQAAIDALSAKQKAIDDQAALDAKAVTDKDAGDKKAFDDQLSKLETRLTTEKGSHTKTLAAIAALYAKAGLDAKASGASITLAIAAGLLSEVKAVEAAMETLTHAISKYIKIGSPAEAGIFHTDPPEAMGRRLTAEWWQGIQNGLAALDIGAAFAGAAGGLQAPAAMAYAGPIAPSAAAAAVPSRDGGLLAPSAALATVPALAGAGDTHITVDLGEKFAELFGTNRYFDTISKGLAWRRR